MAMSVNMMCLLPRRLGGNGFGPSRTVTPCPRQYATMRRLQAFVEVLRGVISGNVSVCPVVLPVSKTGGWGFESLLSCHR